MKETTREMPPYIYDVNEHGNNRSHAMASSLTSFFRRRCDKCPMCFSLNPNEKKNILLDLLERSAQG